jgi:hypothetical protein
VSQYLFLPPTPCWTARVFIVESGEEAISAHEQARGESRHAALIRST